MRFPQQFVQQGVASASIAYPTGTTGVAAAGPTLDSGLVGTSLAAVLAVSLTTSGTTVTAGWQVLIGSTWVAVQSPTTATVLQTGTGTLVATTYYIPAPEGITAGSRSVRLVSTNAVHDGGGVTVDFFTVAYDFRAPSNSLGS
jgi:hypothetical protein